MDSNHTTLVGSLLLQKSCNFGKVEVEETSKSPYHSVMDLTKPTNASLDAIADSVVNAMQAELTGLPKERARQMILETIQGLSRAGYSVVAGDHSLDQRNRADADSGRLLESLATLPLNSLIQIWSNRNSVVWSQTPVLFPALAERLLQIGEPLHAYDVLSEGLAQFPGHLRMRQLLGLALARSGIADAANRELMALYEEGHHDVETCGLLARTFKDLAAEAATPDQRLAHQGEAFRLYLEIFNANSDYWTGINAATLALLLGRQSEAHDLAKRVLSLCEQEREKPGFRESYWLCATIGEAWLVLGDISAAEHWYSRAMNLGKGRFGDFTSTRRNAQIVLEYLGKDSDLLQKWLPIPSVVVFAGPMIDRPDSAVRRFPPELEGPVRDAIAKELDRAGAGFGYSSAACGSDILFLESLMERGGEAHIVLPYNAADFASDCVDFIPGSNWRQRFDSLLARASGLTICTDRPRRRNALTAEYATSVLKGLGLLRARHLKTRTVPLVVWDGRPEDGISGAESMMDIWKKYGHEVRSIDLRELSQGPAYSVSEEPAEEHPDETQGIFHPTLRSLMFSDASGFSRLTEIQVPIFIEQFLGMVGKLADTSPWRPLTRDTWGDALYLVFSSVRAAGMFALELSDRIESTDWASIGLGSLRIRVGLHSGPVFACIDPVTGQETHIGAHVSRAARIEPITPPGRVYASEAFAALAAAEQVQEFQCDYVGQVVMPKKFGTFPTFSVRRLR